jgi:hypothetical protein
LIPLHKMAKDNNRTSQSPPPYQIRMVAGAH